MPHSKFSNSEINEILTSVKLPFNETLTKLGVNKTLTFEVINEPLTVRIRFNNSFTDYYFLVINDLLTIEKTISTATGKKFKDFSTKLYVINRVIRALA